MRGLPSLSTRSVVKARRKAGFVEAPVRGKRSHLALTRRDADDRVRIVILPSRKDLPVGTLRAVIRQSGLSRDGSIALP